MSGLSNSYDWIKIKGLSAVTIPGGGSPPWYAECFQLIGSSDDEAPETELPDAFQEWVEHVSAMDLQTWIEDLYIASEENADDDPDLVPVPIDPIIPVIDIPTLIELFLTNPWGAVLYLVARFGLQIVIGWLKSRILGDKQQEIIRQLKRLVEAFGVLNGVQDTRQAQIIQWLSSLDGNLNDVEIDLKNLTDYFKDGDIVQAVKDLKFNDLEIALPGGGRLHAFGKWVGKP